MRTLKGQSESAFIEMFLNQLSVLNRRIVIPRLDLGLQVLNRQTSQVQEVQDKRTLRFDKVTSSNVSSINRLKFNECG